MNSARALIALLILVSPLASQAQSPELKVLQIEYDNQLSERVADAYNAGLAKLDAGYLAGIDRVLASSKAAGDLEGALSLEAEKKRVAEKGQLPANDEQAAKALKSLRSIYRLELAKLDAQRATNTAALLTPYIAKLKQLETDLTKADRLADAKSVMDYRQGVAAGVPMKTNNAGAPATTPLPPAPIGSFGKEGFANTLDMKFVPVEGTKVLFCIHPTRVKDYKLYDAEVSGVNGNWKTAKHEGIPISRGDDDPVAETGWDDAKGFCAWLSKKEGRTYRLPTDREWSIAVGLGAKEKVTKDTTPERLSGKIDNLFSWGTKWPPTKGAGNYADTSIRKDFPKKEFINGYTDGFPATSPVMSFKPNKYGLYDMDGNLCQWCEDWLNEQQKDRVLRGSSWRTADLGHMLLSNRVWSGPGGRDSMFGFRVVVEMSSP